MQPCLRAVRPGDLDVFFEHQCDAQAAAVAGFVPRTRPMFDDHWRRIVADPETVVRTIEVQAEVAGYVSLFPRDGRSEIAYWIGREHWNRGIGQTAVAALLRLHPDRPVLASVTIGNVASRAILRRCGFRVVAEETAPDGVREQVLQLD